MEYKSFPEDWSSFSVRRDIAHQALQLCGERGNVEVNLEALTHSVFSHALRIGHRDPVRLPERARGVGPVLKVVFGGRIHAKLRVRALVQVVFEYKRLALVGRPERAPAQAVAVRAPMMPMLFGTARTCSASDSSAMSTYLTVSAAPAPTVTSSWPCTLAWRCRAAAGLCAGSTRLASEHWGRCRRCA